MQNSQNFYAFLRRFEVIDEHIGGRDDALARELVGEIIPARTMGFTGDGGSTVKADVGRKLRPRDRDFNLAGAIELAVNDALASSLHTLETAPPAKK